jgi:hypothetical protein
VHRITTGSLLAVGPTTWLVNDCDNQGQCALVAIDRASGSRRVVGPPRSSLGPTGVISPDGTTGAVYGEAQDAVVLNLVDLATGTDRRLDVPIDPDVGREALAWSPDGRWLVIVGANGRLHAYNAESRELSTFAALGAPLPSLDQLAIRNTPTS